MSSSKIPTSLKIPTETSPLRSRRWLAWLAAVSAMIVVGALAVPTAANAAADTSVSGTIRYANDSQPIANATVDFFDAAGDGLTPVVSVTADAAGAYQADGLEPGSYRVRASADPALYMPVWYTGYESFDAATTITLEDGSHPTGVDIYLTDATTSIEGTIRYANDAQPIAGATVEFFDVSGDGTTPVASVVADGNGVYSVTNLPYGSYRVRASADPALYMPVWYTGYESFDAATTITLEDGSHPTGVDIYLTDAPDHPTGDLRGTVFDGATASGIAGATVDVFTAAGDGTTPIESTTTDATGAYEFLDLAPGGYRLRASFAGLVDAWYWNASDFATAQTIGISAGGSHDGYNVTLWSAETSISGRISAGSSNEALIGADVALFDAAGDGTTPVATATTDSEGDYAFTGVAEGDYRVRAASPGLLEGWYGLAYEFESAATVSVVGQSHLTAIDIVLWESQTSIGGVLRSYETWAPIANATVELHPTDLEDPGPSTPITTTTDADGAYVFAGLAVGSYTVHFVGGAGFAEQAWYVNAPDQASATMLFVGSNSHLTNVDGYLGQPFAFTQFGSPLITGDPQLGSDLGVDVGIWSPQPDSFTYQWFSNGVEIPGATGATYTVQAVDRGTRIRVSVEAAKAGFASIAQLSNEVFVPTVTAADVAAALDIDDSMGIGLFGAGAGVDVSSAGFAGFPRAGADYAVLSTGLASRVMQPAEPDVFLSDTLGNAAGVDGNDLTGITVSVNPQSASRCLAIDLKFGSEEYPEFVGTSFNDVFTAETPTSDISKTGSDIVAPNNYAFDAAGNILSINSIVGFAPIAGNAMDGWTTGLTALIPLASGESQVILTLQDIGDSGYDSAVLLDHVRYVPTADCDGGGGATPTDPIVGTTPTITGDVMACTTVGVDPGTWEPEPVELTYQWRIDGVDVEGATESTWTIPATTAGHVVTVVVTGTKVGYLPVSLESAPATIEYCELTPATPIVSGTTTVGEELSVDVGEWVPLPVELSIQWLRDGIPITDATGPEYTLTTADLGALITVAVTGTKMGYTTQVKTSDPAGPIAPADEISGPVPIITGDADTCSVLTVEPGTWTPDPVTLQVQWRIDGDAVAGATDLDFAVPADALGSAVSVAVTGSKAGYPDVTRVSDAVVIVACELAPVPTPTITGEAAVGNSLSAASGDWGPAPVALTYQWFADGDPIPGEDGDELELRPAALGAVITVAVTGSKLGYSDATSVSDPVGPVVAGTLGPVSAPTILGEAAVGRLLAASADPWGPDPVDMTFAWFRDGEPIPGATGAAYTVQPADLGTEITVQATGQKVGYTTESRSSAAVGPIAPGALQPTPTPTITGLAIVGEALTAVPGTWGPIPVQLTLQWFRDGVPIDGAVNLDLALTADDVGALITVAVTGTKSGYATVTRTSTGAGPVAGAPPALDPAPIPTISGDARVGSTLTANAGAWGPAPVVLAYQWYRDGAPVVGAGASTFVLAASDAGSVIEVEVTGSKVGYESATRRSAPTTAVALGILSPAPTPTISGTAVVGGTLTRTTGTWGPAPVTLSTQWLRDGLPIDGAEGATYTLQPLDVGTTITVRVAGTKTGYETTARTSTGTSPVAAGTLTAPTPTISGAVAVGSTLTVQTGNWGPAPVNLTYQWFAGGQPRSGATSTTYTPTLADVGLVITVAVTGSKPGYTTVTRTSAATTPVPAPVVVPGTLIGPMPTISGIPVLDNTLTVVTGTWTPAPVNLSIQWLRNGSPIGGATGLTYTLGTSDVGAFISVRVTGTKAGFATLVRTSAAVGPVTLKSFSSAPTPTISGVTRVANELTANPGTWSPTPTKLSYQWYRGSTPIPGATSKTWLLNGADYNRQIHVVVTAERNGYLTTTRTSAPTSAILPGFMTATPTPTISGQTKVGSTLRVHTGQWQPAPVPVVFTWMRDGVPIAGQSGGADFWTYTLRPADLGHRITVSVRSEKTGYVSVTRTTAPTAVITAKK